VTEVDPINGTTSVGFLIGVSAGLYLMTLPAASVGNSGSRQSSANPLEREAKQLSYGLSMQLELPCDDNLPTLGLLRPHRHGSMVRPRA
jgi:hypothetical protein